MEGNTHPYCYSYRLDEDVYNYLVDIKEAVVCQVESVFPGEGKLMLDKLPT